MAEIKYDVKRGAEIYRAIYGSRLKNWISTGKIKRGEVLVWRSGLSGWRRPEELKELKPYLGQWEKRQLTRIKRKEHESGILPSKKIKNILIIDDEKDLCLLLSDALSQKNYNVSIANTKEKGMDCLKKELPDLVLLDLKLPDGNGMKIFPELKKLTRKPIVIVISAYGSEESREEAKEQGAYAFLDKPFTEEDILKRIEKLNKKKTRD